MTFEPANLVASSQLERLDVMWRDVSGETVVLDAEGKLIVGLNSAGGQVWELLDGRRTLTDIAELLVEAHGISAERALADVLAFARALVARRLAQVANQRADRHEAG